MGQNNCLGVSAQPPTYLLTLFLQVLIYVFDVESRELEKDMHYYQSCLEAIMTFSAKAKIFCLVHKMDLIQEDQRDLMFEEREAQLQKLSLPLEVRYSIVFNINIYSDTVIIGLCDYRIVWLAAIFINSVTRL